MKKAIIIVYCLAIVFVCIYVPWKAEIQGSYYSAGATLSLSYSFIWTPQNRIAVVDFNRVILEIIGITALSGIVFVLFGGFKR